MPCGNADQRADSVVKQVCDIRNARITEKRLDQFYGHGEQKAQQKRGAVF